LVFFPDFNGTFLDRFSKNTKISNLMKILALGAELLHPAGKTDMTKLTVAFRQSADAPKIAGSNYNQTCIVKSSAQYSRYTKLHAYKFLSGI
jgi:hypothetical protein